MPCSCCPRGGPRILAMPRQLLEGEDLVLQLHRHWVLLGRWLGLPLTLVVLFCLAIYAAGGRLPGDVKLFLLLLALATLGLWTIVAWLRWTAVSLTLTDQRVILESGVIGRASKVIALDRVQDVATRQSPWGRLFGYGTVQIDAMGASGTELVPYVPGPERLRDEVFVQSGASRRAGRT